MTTSFEENTIKIIPKNWKEVIFSDVVDINPKRALTKGSITKHIAMEYLKPFQKQINNYTLREFKGGSKFQNNDTLFARITPSLENGKTGFVDILDEKEIGFGSTEFIVMAAKEGEPLSNYVYYLSRTSHVRNIAINAMTGTSGRQRVDDAVFDSIIIRIPTEMQEQLHISKILSDFDSKIELLQKQNKILEQIAQTIFKSWFVDFDGITEFEDSELGDIPKGWRIMAIDQLASINPESWSRTNNPQKVEYVDLRNVKWGVIEHTQHFLWNDAPSRAQRILRSGDTIVGTVRPANGSYSLIMADGLTGSTGFAVLRPRSPLYREFIYLAATSSENIERLAHRADGAAYPSVRSDVIGKTKVMVPYSDTNILERFSKIVSPLFRKIAFNKTESRTLSILRDTLLPKLMSGEIRV